MRVTQNPDSVFAKEVKKQIKANNGYCPCRLTKSPDTKCMCRDFREMIDRGEEGACLCGLYIATND